MPKIRPITCDWRGETEADDCHEPATHELLDHEEHDEDGETFAEILGCFCAKHAVMALEDELRTHPSMAVRS